MEEKITELATKLNKHSERLATSHLPTKWHMPSRIEEDISKEHTKLDELQAELRKLELQASSIQDLIDHSPGSEDEVGDEDFEDPGILDVSNLSLGEDSDKCDELSSLGQACNFISVIWACILFRLAISISQFYSSPTMPITATPN